MNRYIVTSNYVESIRDFMSFVDILQGVSVELHKRLDKQVEEAKGTPQAPNAWKDASEWISRLLAENILDEETSNLAKKISDAGSNPRYLRVWEARVAERHGFLRIESGKYVLTEIGKKFAQGEQTGIDKYAFENGIFQVLTFLEEDVGTTKDKLIQKWKTWVNSYGGRNVHAESVLEEGVKSRIDNVLIPLGYVRKEGIPRRYYLTNKGFQKVESLRRESVDGEKEQEIQVGFVKEEDIQLPPKGERIKEEDFYKPFAYWLEKKTEECTKAMPLGGNKFKDKWGTPDVIGKRVPHPSDIIKGTTEIISAEIKVDTRDLITAFGQACSYKLFSNKSYIVVPKNSPVDDLSKLDSLCLIFGIGLVLFDNTNPDDPKFEIKCRPFKHDPDMYYVNKYMKLIVDDLFR